MFKFFEGLVDPYIDYDKNETPSRRLYPFLRNYARPFDRIFLIAGLLTVVIAASEILLLSYMGRLVDLLVGPPTNVQTLIMTEAMSAFLSIIMIAIASILLKTQDGATQIIECGPLAIFPMAYLPMEDA